MENSNNQEQLNKKNAKVETCNVPFTQEEIQYISAKREKNESKNKLIKQAFKFHAEGNIAAATKYYQSFINQGFSDTRVFCNLGIILREAGNLKEAEIITRKAIEIDPRFAKGHYNLGNILNDLGQLEEAELSMLKAIKLNPNFADAFLNLAKILRDQGKSKEALFFIEKAIKIRPWSITGVYGLDHTCEIKSIS